MFHVFQSLLIKCLTLVLWISPLSAQTINSAQPFQPWGNNYAARSSAPLNYGYPRAGPLESDVIAQFIFDTTGNIVDEVTGTYTLSAVGVPVYEFDSSSYSSFMSKSIHYDSTANRHENTTAEASYDLSGTDDFTVEWVAAIDGAAVIYHWTINAVSNVARGMTVYQANATTLQVVVSSDDVTLAANNYTISDNTDSVFRKYRATFDRSGNCEFFIDGATQGTFSISSLNNKTITHEGLKLGGQFNNGGEDIDGKLVEWRWSRNLTNSSGGPGGG